MNQSLNGKHKVYIYRWEDDFREPVHISHNVTNFEFLYEPFYVAPDTVPPHDERFLGYGFTRNTQVNEGPLKDFLIYIYY